VPTGQSQTGADDALRDDFEPRTGRERLADLLNLGQDLMGRLVQHERLHELSDACRDDLHAPLV
jgi:hypothetical protein